MLGTCLDFCDPAFSTLHFCPVQGPLSHQLIVCQAPRELGGGKAATGSPGSTGLSLVSPPCAGERQDFREKLPVAIVALTITIAHSDF